MAEEGSGLFQTFLRALIPLRRVLLPWPDTITWGLGFHTLQWVSEHSEQSRIFRFLFLQISEVEEPVRKGLGEIWKAKKQEESSGGVAASWAPAGPTGGQRPRSWHGWHESDKWLCAPGVPEGAPSQCPAPTAVAAPFSLSTEAAPANQLLCILKVLKPGRATRLRGFCSLWLPEGSACRSPRACMTGLQPSSLRTHPRWGLAHLRAGGACFAGASHKSVLSCSPQAAAVWSGGHAWPALQVEEPWEPCTRCLHPSSPQDAYLEEKPVSADLTCNSHLMPPKWSPRWDPRTLASHALIRQVCTGGTEVKGRRNLTHQVPFLMSFTYEFLPTRWVTSLQLVTSCGTFHVEPGVPTRAASSFLGQPTSGECLGCGQMAIWIEHISHLMWLECIINDS